MSNWKKDLSDFLTSKNHWCTSELEKKIIIPALSSLNEELNRFDYFQTKIYEREFRDEERGIILKKYHLVLDPRYPTYFRFHIEIWIDQGLIYVLDNSQRVEMFDDMEGKDLSKYSSIKEKRIQKISPFEVFEPEYLGAILSRIFQNYYLEVCQFNQRESLEFG